MQISYRLSRSAVWRWVSPARWPVVLLAGAVLLPLIRLALAWLNLTPEVWQHLWETLLPEMVLNTVLLTAGVGAVTLCLGTTLAWLVTNFDFPGARLAEWLLVLPLAIPSYIFGYVFMALFDYAGPFQSQLRAWFGPSLELPEFRSLPGAIFTLSLSLYPYVYLLARAGFWNSPPPRRTRRACKGIATWRSCSKCRCRSSDPRWLPASRWRSWKRWPTSRLCATSTRSP